MTESWCLADYDAVLTEAGDYTAKYFKLRSFFGSISGTWQSADLSTDLGPYFCSQTPKELLLHYPTSTSVDLCARTFLDKDRQV